MLNLYLGVRVDYRCKPCSHTHEPGPVAFACPVCSCFLGVNVPEKVKVIKIKKWAKALKLMC